MTDEQSISVWLDGLKQGDDRAAEVIWRRYFEKLVGLARQRLAGQPRRIADEEDVALSAFKSVVLGARAARFPRLDDRTDLWKILVVVTARKAIAQKRRHFAGTRPDARVVEPSAGDDEGTWMSAIMGREPTPDLASQFAEETQRLLAALPGDEFRRVALFKLDGYTNREIAEQLGWYEVKVERRLRIIRKCWDFAETDDERASPAATNDDERAGER